MEIDRTVTTVIDRERCIGCGLCIEVCPFDTISLKDGKAFVTGDESLNCGHCEAACPVGAIRVNGVDRSLSSFATFHTKEEWLPHGRPDTGSLVNLMQSRRACRNFKDQPVHRNILEDLVKIGITAPSGSNCQQWSFTILPDRKTVVDLGHRTADFFRRLNKLSEKAWLRSAMRMMGKPELESYYQHFYETIKDGLREWEKGGADPLFHGAPAAIVVGSQTHASCPAEDALLATQNILLGAHSMGLGTCLIGFVVKAMEREKRIRQSIGIPDDEAAYAVIALGHPAEKYEKVTGRRRVIMRYVEGE